MSSDKDRKKEEIEFHNKIRTVTTDAHVSDTRWSPQLEKTIQSDPMWTNMKYYAIERRSRDMVLQWFKANCPGKKVLDYCCGNGEDGLIIAQNGATQVTGIDISDVSIKNCQTLAEKNGVAARTEYKVMDAEKTDFPDNSFDVITEYGALHHLDLEKAMSELAIIVRPDGKVICNEALGHNPVIAAYRKLTPKLRTEWEAEHIMKRPQFDIVKRHFGSVDMHFYHLFTLFAVPLRNTPLFQPVLGLLEAIDKIILRLPGVKWQAWQVVFVMTAPHKKSREN